MRRRTIALVGGAAYVGLVIVTSPAHAFIDTVRKARQVGGVLDDLVADTEAHIAEMAGTILAPDDDTN